MAEAFAPGQGDQLLQISQLDPHISNTKFLDQATDNEMIKNLKKIYDLYVEQKMPYIEHVRLLSLLPRSWSYEKIMELFGCSRHAIKIAHRMYDEQQYVLTRDSKPSIRQRADPEKITHFVNWLVESNTLVSGTYGLTVLRMDNGDKYELPKQVLQLQKYHALISYKNYCNETDFEGLGNIKLYDILNSIKPAQQQAVAGLDEFVVEGVEAWCSLSNARCTKSVSIPAPVHYADLAAYAARMFEFGDDLDHNEEVGDEFDPTENISLNDIETKVMTLNDKIQNNMWFV
ncbi:unnamed protein product [Rotaria sp. Silwood2]|nr:unnamed protein product [Rotaria sp. Silwood2]